MTEGAGMIRWMWYAESVGHDFFCTLYDDWAEQVLQTIRLIFCAYELCSDRRV